MAAQVLANQINRAAEMLAARVEAGEFDVLTAEQRCDLRHLTLTMAGWADRLETEAWLEAVPVPDPSGRWHRWHRLQLGLVAAGVAGWAASAVMLALG